MGAVGVAALVAVLVAGWVAWAYNRLVVSRNRAADSWAAVDVELKRRHDLVGRLTGVVQGYAAHERAALEEAVIARIVAERAADAESATAAEIRLGNALDRLVAVAEALPELQAAERFAELVTALSEVEGRIAIARLVYNDTALRQNDHVQTLPSALVARMFGFRPLAYFEPDEPAG